MNGILKYLKTEMNENHYIDVCPALAGHQCQRSMGMLGMQNHLVLGRIFIHADFDADFGNNLVGLLLPYSISHFTNIQNNKISLYNFIVINKSLYVLCCDQ